MKTTMLTLCMALILIGGLIVSADANQLRQILWQDLIPETQAFDDPFEALSQDQLADLSFVARVRHHTDLPLAVGFGVSTAEQAGEVARYADGVIIGSSLVDIVRKSESVDAAVSGVRAFLEGAARAVDAK